MNKLMILVPMAVLLLSGVTTAQPMHKGCAATGTRGEQESRWNMRGPRQMDRMSGLELPDLSDEQKGKLDKIQVEHMKAVQPLRNKLMERRAELHTLSTAEEVNMGKINALIEEMGKIRIEMMKEHEKHRQDVRKILNEKQRLIFDSRPMHRRDMMGD